MTRRENQRQIIFAQLEEVKNQQEAILDKRLGIRTRINQRLRVALVEDENIGIDQMKTYLESQSAKDFERLQARSQKLDARELELKAKRSSSTFCKMFQIPDSRANPRIASVSLGSLFVKHPRLKS